jgi:predicted dinucleotide-binding enzyme
MKIVVLGRGNVGRGLARLWQAAGHEVETLTREGGDASGAEVIVVAVPKAFNTNFAAIYDQIGSQRVRPGCLYCADPDAKEATEQLIRDAGYDRCPRAGSSRHRALEDALGLIFAISQKIGGPFFYRMALPGNL